MSYLNQVCRNFVHKQTLVLSKRENETKLKVLKKKHERTIWHHNYMLIRKGIDMKFEYFCYSSKTIIDRI